MNITFESVNGSDFQLLLNSPNGFYKKLGWTATGVMEGNDEVFKKNRILPNDRKYDNSKKP